MRYVHLQYVALNNTDESNDNYTSAKYVAQRVMENACRWVSAIIIQDNTMQALIIYYYIIIRYKLWQIIIVIMLQ